MRRLAATICVVIIPIGLLLAFVGYEFTAYRVFEVPNAQRIMLFFSSFPTFSDWFKYSFGAAAYSDIRALVDAWRNINNVGDFFAAFGASFVVFPEVLYCLLLILLYPFAVISWGLFTLFEWLIQFSVEQVGSETSLQALRGFQGGSLLDVLRCLVV